MYRNYLAIIASATLLSVSILIWRDMFLFSKVVYLPTWTAILPSPINTPVYVAFVCLLPAAFIPSTPQGAAHSLVWTVLFSPSLALIAYVAGTISPDSNLWLNAAFNYAWVIGFHCFLPALGLFAVRILAAVVKRRRVD